LRSATVKVRSYPCESFDFTYLSSLRLLLNPLSERLNVLLHILPTSIDGLTARGNTQFIRPWAMGSPTKIVVVRNLAAEDFLFSLTL